LEYRKWVDIGLRLLGLVLLYQFLSEAMTLANLLIGYRELRSHAFEGTVLHVVLDLMAGSYLLFFPKNVLRLITNDARNSESIDFEDDYTYRNILEIGIKLIGVYLFYLFMYFTVTALNVAMGNYTPGNVETAGFSIQAVFHLLVSLFFMFRTKKLLAVIFKK
jgi:hypothetical protein